MEYQHRDKYKSTRDRVTKFKHNYNMSDKEIIEFLDNEIREYRDTIEKQSKVIKELQDKQKTTSGAYEELKGLEVELNGIKGTIENIELHKVNYYADNLKYYEEVFYEIEILTDDMYTVKIEPIAEGTLKELYKSNKIIKEYKLNNGLKIS